MNKWLIKFETQNTIVTKFYGLIWQAIENQKLVDLLQNIKDMKNSYLELPAYNGNHLSNLHNYHASWLSIMQ